MNSRFFSLIFTAFAGAFFAFSAEAQTALSDAVPAPPPNPGHWKEVVVPVKITNAAPVKPVETVEPQWLRREVILVGDTRQEILTWTSGEVTEQWIIGGVLFDQVPGKKGVYIHDPRMEGIHRVPPLNSWEGLEWIRPGLKMVRSSFKGRECLLLENGPKRLRLDAESRLPLIIENDTEQILFTYLSPPSKPPQPTGACAAVINGYKKKMESMTVNLAPR